MITTSARTTIEDRTPTLKTAQTLLVERKVFWSTLQGTLVTGNLAAILNVPAPAGFLVKTVAQGSTAWNMGLAGGDRIVTLDGKEIALGGDIILSVEGIPVVSENNIEKIRTTLAAKPPGTPFKMTVLPVGLVAFSLAVDAICVVVLVAFFMSALPAGAVGSACSRDGAVVFVALAGAFFPPSVCCAGVGISGSGGLDSSVFGIVVSGMVWTPLCRRSGG